MFKFTPTRTGLKNLRAIGNLKTKINDGVTLGLYDIGRKIRPDIIRSITDEVKTGNVYLLTLNGRRVVHQASAAGEAPANFTGKLKRSVDYKIRKGGNEMIIGAGSRKVNYARRLELGGGNIKPRPFIKPQLTKNQKFIMEFIRKGIARSLHIN